MRMEELSDNRYIKDTDSVEKYLLGVIQDYFKNKNITDPASKEFIIQKALKRMQEEIDFESLGVLSITMPDGTVKKGAVTITIEELNGEPKIENKGSAFNVNFGTEEGTACKGNDPRLSDKRMPVAHTHPVSEILGLEGELSSIKNEIQRLNIHEHGNKNVLDIIKYTGDKTEVDLIDVENLKKSIEDAIGEFNGRVNEGIKETAKIAGEANNKADEIKNEISNLKNYASDKITESQAEINTYTDNKTSETKTELTTKMNNEFISKEKIKEIISVINKSSYIYAGSVSENIMALKEENYEFNISMVKEFIENHNPSYTMDDIKINGYIKILSEKYPLPYYITENKKFKGVVQLKTNELIPDIEIIHEGEIEHPLSSGIIIIEYYIRQNISV